MIKHCYLHFPNGETYKVPAEIIAMNRTSYYAEEEDFKEGSGDWNDEWGRSMKIDELRYWIVNKMCWDDVKDHAKLVSENRRDYDTMWSNLEIEC